MRVQMTVGTENDANSLVAHSVSLWSSPAATRVDYFCNVCRNDRTDARPINGLSILFNAVSLRPPARDNRV